jgi:insulysin
LYCDIVDYELMEFSYSAELAGMKFLFSMASNGFQVIFKGYNQKIAEFIQSWANEVVNLKLDEDRFKIIKEDLLDQYLNFMHEEPRKMVTFVSKPFKN